MSGWSDVFEDKFEKFKNTKDDRLKSVENGDDLILKKLGDLSN